MTNRFLFKFRILCIYCFVLASLGNTQVPTLNPEQTVNPGTGAMGFSLPLLNVKGINGHDFPVNLNYQAGINYHQEAGPAGLGFAYGAGSITRQIVFVADDNAGNTPYVDGNGKTYYAYQNEDCHMSLWKQALLTFCQVLGCIIGIILCFTGIGSPWGVGLFCASLALTAVQITVSSITFSPADFRAGGPHTPSYNFRDWDGKGYFVPGGEVNDLPDIYFVNTPYISGQLVWVGNRQNGYFVLKQTGGCATAQNTTTKITYDVPNETFRIQLVDGTILIFDETDRRKSNTTMAGNTHIDDGDCGYNTNVKGLNAIVDQWHLTKVLFPDFKGSEATPDVGSTGSWIKFKYDVLQSPNWSFTTSILARPEINIWQQVSERDVTLDQSTLTRTCFLKTIITPNQNAQFSYSYNRLDACRLYGNGSTGILCLMPRLNQIKILSNKGAVCRTADFETDYILRGNSLNTSTGPTPFNNTYYSFNFVDLNGAPISLNAIDNPVPGNPSKASLTLTKVTITDGNGRKLPPIVFTYNGDNNPALTLTNGECPMGSSNGNSVCLLEQHDLWGFYLPINNGAINNDFNAIGGKTRMQRGNLLPDGSWNCYADAWSLKKINLPTGASIEWQYESNRYRYANGIQVSSADNEPRYGGGIRVKKLILQDGTTANPITLSYFYTSKQDGTFDEALGTSSGYCIAEPYNYIQINGDDYRLNDNTKGGLYTPSKVAYSKVQVVKNYQSSAPHAPNGYTVSNLTHAGNPNVAGFYPDSGRYGESDYSWKTGFPVSQLVKNKNDITISQTQSFYDFVTQTPVHYSNFNIFDPQYGLMASGNKIGWVKLLKTETTLNDVKTKKEFKYAMDVSSNNPDLINYFSQNIIKFTIDGSGPGSVDCPNEGGFCIYPNPPNPVLDSYVLVTVANSTLNSFQPSFYVSIGKDVPNNNPGGGAWTEWKQFPLPYIDNYKLLGVTLWWNNAEANYDLIIAIQGKEYLYVCEVHNINFVYGENGNPNTVSCDPFSSSNIAEIPLTSWNINQYMYFCSCAITNLNNNLLPDLVFLEANETSVSCTEDNWGTLSPRHLYAISDFQDGTIPAENQFYYSGNTTYLLKGSKIKFRDYDNNGGINDLIVAGPGPSLFSYSFLTNVDLVPGAGIGVVQADTAPVSQTDLFNVGRYCPSGDKRFIGVDYNPSQDRQYFAFRSSSYFTFIQQKIITCHSDRDGQPNRIIETNSDATKRITVPTPAYWKPVYAEMANTSHQLTPTCQTTVYQGDPPVAANAVSSKVTSWQSINGVWLPQNSFVWKVPLSNTTGLPTAGNSLVDFDFTGGANDLRWKNAGGVTLYSPNSNPIETKNPLDKYSATVYGAFGNLPIGSIAPANFYESGVFTGDYDFNIPGDQNGIYNGYFDKDNGWEKTASTTLSKDYVHFGQKSIKMTNGECVCRNFKIRANIAYKASAWVNVTSAAGTIQMLAEYWPGTGPTVTTWPLHWDQLGSPISSVQYGTLQGNTNGQWVNISMITTPQAGDNNWVRLRFIGAGAGPCAYVDDIRFAPSKAQVSTTYYDTLWQQPILSVDGNGNPGKLIKFDGFGRPFEWWKIDNNQSRGITAADHLVQEKAYYLPGQSFFTPNPAKWYNIFSRANKSFCIDASLNTEIADGSTVYTYQNWGGTNQQWKFVDAGSGYYQIVSRYNPAYALDIADNSITNNTHVQMFTASLADDYQKWQLVNVASDYYKIIAKMKDAGQNSYAIDGDISSSPIGNGNQIRICSIGNGRNQEWQIVEAPADLPADAVEVASPNGGEVFVSPQPIIISWNASPNVNSVELLYSLDNGTTYNSIATVNKADAMWEKYIWNSPPAGFIGINSCRIQVKNIATGGTDVSNYPFTVKANIYYNGFNGTSHFCKSTGVFSTTVNNQGYILSPCERLSGANPPDFSYLPIDQTILNNLRNKKIVINGFVKNFNPALLKCGFSVIYSINGERPYTNYRNFISTNTWTRIELVVDLSGITLNGFKFGINSFGGVLLVDDVSLSQY